MMKIRSSLRPPIHRKVGNMSFSLIAVQKMKSGYIDKRKSVLHRISATEGFSCENGYDTDMQILLLSAQQQRRHDQSPSSSSNGSPDVLLIQIRVLARDRKTSIRLQSVQKSPIALT